MKWKLFDGSTSHRRTSVVTDWRPKFAVRSDKSSFHSMTALIRDAHHNTTLDKPVDCV
jgi:hypothetical protein